MLNLLCFNIFHKMTPTTHQKAVDQQLNKCVEVTDDFFSLRAFMNSSISTMNIYYISIKEKKKK